MNSNGGMKPDLPVRWARIQTTKGFKADTTQPDTLFSKELTAVVCKELDSPES